MWQNYNMTIFSAHIPITHHSNVLSPRQAIMWHPAHASLQLYMAHEASVASVLMYPICRAHCTAVVTIPIHHMIFLPSIQAEIICGAALATVTVTFTHLGTACFYLQYNFSSCLTHVHIHTCNHNSIYTQNHILWHNFNHLHIYSKLFDITAVSH